MVIKRLLTIFSLTLGLAVTFAILAGMHTAQAAQSAADRTLCLAGLSTCGYSTIQAAVDAADKGDIIKVAAGII